jgi:hypothetical protein
VQFTPTHAFLAAKGYDMSSLSFKDYLASGFKGDVMLFDYDDNFKKGWHFSSGKTKEIHLYNKLAAANRTRQTVQNSKTGEGNHSTPATNQTSEIGPPDNCNGIPFEPNCVYTIHVEYEYTCSGGWNPEEGFNPDYCHILQYTVVGCELQYCNPTGGNAYEECLNAGNTQEECMCTVYGIGCDSGGGGEEEDEEACNQFNTNAEAFIANNSEHVTSAMPVSPSFKDTTVKWVVTRAYNGYWQVVAYTQMRYNGYLNNNVYFTDVQQFQTVSTQLEELLDDAWFKANWTQGEITNQVYNNNTAHPEGITTVKGTAQVKYKKKPNFICHVLEYTKNVSNGRGFEFW